MNKRKKIQKCILLVVTTRTICVQMIMATSIGTSMGTIAAMAPIAINVAQGAHLNVAIVGAAVIGGTGSGTIKAGSYNIIEVLPYLIVLGAALMGINVAVVLFVGILSAGIIGLCVGSCGFFDWI